MRASKHVLVRVRVLASMLFVALFFMNYNHLHSTDVASGFCISLFCSCFVHSVCVRAYVCMPLVHCSFHFIKSNMIGINVDNCCRLVWIVRCRTPCIQIYTNKYAHRDRSRHWQGHIHTHKARAHTHPHHLFQVRIRMYKIAYRCCSFALH